jgi:hypothetical protein
MGKIKYRTDTRDSAPKPPKAKPEDKPGTIQPGRLAVFDAGPLGDGKGRRHRGTVGPKATAATASRFNKQHGSKLGTGPDGKQAWLGPTLGEISAQGSATPGAQGDTLADESSRGVTATKIKSGGH